MSILDVTFDIPNYIQNGFETGLYERVGGVVREVDSGQIVAWLRETNPLELANATTKLLSNANVFGVLNLAATTVGTAVILDRLSSIENTILKLSDGVSEANRKLDLTTYAKLSASLKALNMSLASTRNENRSLMAASALDGLLSSAHYFKNEAERDAEQGFIYGYPLLSTLVLTVTAGIKCLTSLSEVEQALQYHDEALQFIERLYRQYVRHRFSPYYIIYRKAATIIRADNSIPDISVEASEELTLLAYFMHKLNANDALFIARWLGETSEFQDFSTQVTSEIEYNITGLMRMRDINAEEATAIARRKDAAVGQKKSFLSSVFGTPEESRDNDRSREIDKENKRLNACAIQYPKLLNGSADWFFRHCKLSDGSVPSQDVIDEIKSAIEDFNRFRSYGDELQFMLDNQMSLLEWNSLKPEAVDLDRKHQLMTIRIKNT